MKVSVINAGLVGVAALGLTSVFFTVGPGLSDKAGAEKILDDNGYTNINVSGAGSSWFDQCGFSKNSFNAISAGGKQVEGTVCQGGPRWDYTLRINNVNP